MLFEFLYLKLYRKILFGHNGQENFGFINKIYDEYNEENKIIIKNGVIEGLDLLKVYPCFLNSQNKQKYVFFL